MIPSFTISGRRHKSVYTWDKFMSTEEWTEKNVYLNSDVSPITGYIQLKYTPHLKEIFKDYDNHLFWKHTFQASTQCAKTTAIFCLAFKGLDTDPAKSGIFIPADDGVRDYVNEKVDPFLRGVKPLQPKLEVYKEESKKKIISATKSVSGGSLGINGTSARQRRSKTLKRVFLDEVSLFPKASVTEIISRTKFFEKFFRKVFLSSSIKEKDDEIVKSYDDSEVKKEWQMECSCCGEKFYPTSKHFKYMTKSEYAKKHEVTIESINHDLYRDEALEDVYVECPHCEYHIDSEEKDEMVLTDKITFVTVEDNGKAGTVGYKANALGMFPTRYETIAKLLIDAKEKYSEMSIIYVEYFNEIYEEDLEGRISKNDILLLGNEAPKWIIPQDTVKVYLTVDTQKDHFYFAITAFQYGFVANTVAHGRIETTHDIKELLYMTLQDAKGRNFKIDRCMIDRRGISERTTVVDEFVIEILEETGEMDLIYAFEGVAEIAGNQLLRMKRYKKELDGEEYEFKVMSVSNLLAKNELSSMIQRTIKKVKASEQEPASDYSKRLFYINKDIVEEETILDAEKRTTIHSYCRHMTSEAKTKNKQGKDIWEKINSSVRNDYNDCAYMAIALAEQDLVGNLQKPIESNDDGSYLIGMFNN